MSADSDSLIEGFFVGESGSGIGLELSDESGLVKICNDGVKERSHGVSASFKSIPPYLRVAQSSITSVRINEIMVFLLVH